MGYTTEFEGTISITPPLTPSQIKKVNRFCEERHGGAIKEFPGCPSLWCDYAVSEDGSEIGWNGSEKSYEMENWLPVLIEKFFKPWGRTLNGELRAQGEDSRDTWLLRCTNNEVKRLEAKVVYQEI